MIFWGFRRTRRKKKRRRVGGGVGSLDFESILQSGIGFNCRFWTLISLSSYTLLWCQDV